MGSLTQPSGLHACQVTVCGSLFTDDEEEAEDAPARPKRKFPKDKFPAIWRQSRQGRQRAKDPPPTARTHGRILLHHYSMAAASEDDSVPAYNLLMAKKVPSKSVSNEMPPTKVLLDTGASMSLMPLWQANILGIDVKPRRDIVIRGADGQPLAVQGTGEIWVRDPLATFWKKVKLVITMEGSWTLISPRDQKRLLLLQRDYPRFLGEGRYRRKPSRTQSNINAGSDSGLSSSNSDSESDSEEEEKCDNSNVKTKSVNSVETGVLNGDFTSPLPRDEVEVRFDGQDFEVTYGEDIASECDRAEAFSEGFCNSLGSHYAREILGEGLAALLVDTSKQGKPDDDDDDDPDCGVGPSVDEEELIAQKTEFERKFILEFRNLFSETLSPNRHLRAPPMKISIKDSPHRSRDPALYRFKPRPIPTNIKPQARGMMTDLESQGVIRRKEANEQSDFY